MEQLKKKHTHTQTELRWVCHLLLNICYSCVYNWIISHSIEQGFAFIETFGDIIVSGVLPAVNIKGGVNIWFDHEWTTKMENVLWIQIYSENNVFHYYSLRKILYVKVVVKLVSRYFYCGVMIFVNFLFVLRNWIYTMQILK